MNDPSFILNGAEATKLRDMARELQALLESREAALDQPVSTFGDLEEDSMPAPREAEVSSARS